MNDELTQVAKREAAVRLDHRVEVIAAILLAIATLASAWSAFQATLWNGEQTFRLSEANAARTESVRLSNLALAQQSVDVDMFVQYAVAVSEKNQVIADFLYQRFRPEMKVALDAWLATKPLQNPDAPPSPFAMPDYSLQARKDSDRSLQLAEEKGQAARDADQIGDDYVRQTVLFTVVLLFSGLATTLDYKPVKIGVLVLAAIVFVVALVLLLTSPVQ
jgi:hypothetical protein